METRVTSKNTSMGFIEVKQSGTDYRLYVDGVLKSYSSDLNYIMGEYDRYH